MQRVVVYDSARGKGLVYDTVYDDEQSKRAVRACVAAHGKDANVRTAPAAEHAARHA